ncbi:MAG: Uma2 family endonuclease [Thermosynechococcaceae cyanobacterium]
MLRLDANPPPVHEDAPDAIKRLPTNLYSDEPPLETDFHRNQIDLLIRLLHYWWRDRSDFYISGNLTVYYNEQQLKNRDFRGTDVFVVLGTEKRDRRSWTLWEEGGKYPNVVIELLSDSTATIDRGPKKDLYQDVWRVPEYYWFHPETMEFAGFRLMGGIYAAIAPTKLGRLPCEQLGLELGIHGQQLRWFTAEGDLIPLPEEAERQRADQAQQRAEQERQAKERLEAYLRSRGIDPNQLPNSC